MPTTFEHALLMRSFERSVELLIAHADALNRENYELKKKLARRQAAKRRKS